MSLGSAKATIQHQQLKIYLTDAEYNNVDITGVEPAVTVSAGEKVTLVAVVGTNWVPVTWKLPGKGEVVQNYDPTLATNQLTPLGQTIDGPRWFPVRQTLPSSGSAAAISR